MTEESSVTRNKLYSIALVLLLIRCDFVEHILLQLPTTAVKRSLRALLWPGLAIRRSSPSAADISVSFMMHVTKCKQGSQAQQMVLAWVQEVCVGTADPTESLEHMGNVRMVQQILRCYGGSIS